MSSQIVCDVLTLDYNTVLCAWEQKTCTCSMIEGWHSCITWSINLKDINETENLIGKWHIQWKYGGLPIENKLKNYIQASLRFWLGRKCVDGVDVDIVNIELLLL